MKIAVLFKEAWHSALNSRIASLLIVLTTGAMVVVTALTAGSIQAQRESIEAALTSEATRTITVTANKGPSINSATVAAISHVSTAESVIAATAPIDVSNSAFPGGRAYPMWNADGTFGTALHLVQGRWPQPGEAIISRSVHKSFGLSTQVGAAEGRDGLQVPIVGVYVARPAFEHFNSGLIRRPPAQEASRFATVAVVATSLSAIRPTASSISGIVRAADPSWLVVSSPANTAQQSLDLLDRISRTAAGTLVTVVAAGVFFVLTVVLADVLIRARDLGRRRTLGISRLDLILLVTVRMSICAFVGAILGAIASMAIGIGIPAITLAMAGILAITVATVASIPPAVYAAWRDPVRVLRTP